MYSVILTELGIAVFDNEKCAKSFAFSNPTEDYISIKNGELKISGLEEYLASLQIGVLVNDESLLEILKKSSIDSQIMNEEVKDGIQSTKPTILVESGFAKDASDAMSKLRDFAMQFSSSKVTEVSQSPDLHIIQAINTLDETDKIANAISSRLREWYGLHFPELDNMIDSINGYSQIVVAGKRENLSKEVFEKAGFPESKTEMLSLINEKSRGGDISEENLAIVQSLANQILELHALRKNLEEHIEKQMKEYAPNLAAILGTAVGARILARAGDLKRMASMPASTIQVLGAEKALFRSLKTGSQPPKHGLLFQHALVHAAPRWQRGKIARAIAAKAAIAARADVYGSGLNEVLVQKLNTRVNEIAEKYKNPVEKTSDSHDFREKKEFKQDKPKRSDRGFGEERKSRDRDSRPKRFGDDRRTDKDRRSGSRGFGEERKSRDGDRDTDWHSGSRGGRSDRRSNRGGRSDRRSNRDRDSRPKRFGDDRRTDKDRRSGSRGFGEERKSRDRDSRPKRFGDDRRTDKDRRSGSRGFGEERKSRDGDRDTDWHSGSRGGRSDRRSNRGGRSDRGFGEERKSRDRDSRPKRFGNKEKSRKRSDGKKKKRAGFGRR